MRAPHALSAIVLAVLSHGCSDAVGLDESDIWVALVVVLALLAAILMLLRRGRGR